jgi:hypothetical protein
MAEDTKLQNVCLKIYAVLLERLLLMTAHEKVRIYRKLSLFITVIIGVNRMYLRLQANVGVYSWVGTVDVVVSVAFCPWQR